MSTPVLMDPRTGQTQTPASGVLIETRSVGLKSQAGPPLLQDLTLYLRPQQLIALTGPDHAAREAFIAALSGLRVPDQGDVLLDGVNLHKNWKVFQPRIGLVPGVDGLQPEMTVQEAVQSAARLRLPRSIQKPEREGMVAEALTAMSLLGQAQQRISSLSSEERWRTSIAVELVARPILLLLEQAAVRLDPQQEAETFRRLKDLTRGGMTVIAESSLSASIQAADQVIVLAPEGSLAWFGPPEEALSYFQESFDGSSEAGSIAGFEGVSTLLANAGVSSQDWSKRFRAHPAYKEYVDGWMNVKNPDLLLQDQPLTRLRRQMGDVAPPAPVTQASSFTQLFFLLWRDLRLLFRSRTGWWMLAIPLVAGLTDFLFSSPQMNNPDTGDPFWAPAATAFLVILGLLVMALLFSPAIVRERASLQRERWQNLRSFPYILAKVVVAGLFAIYAGLVWAAIHFIASGSPGGILTAGLFWITLALLAWVGGLLGLLASALSSSAGSAARFAVLFVVPQLIFSGGFLPLNQSLPAASTASYLVPARYGFDSLLTASGYGSAIANDPCWQLPADQRNSLDDQQKQACNCLGSNIFSKCNFPGVHRSFNTSIEQQEPVQPTPDANLTLPVQPVLQPGENLNDFAKAVNDYTLALESYQGSSDAFITSLRQYFLANAAWQRDRGLAIGGAEGQLELAVTRFGSSFQANLPLDWLALGGFGLLFVILLGLVQRGKGMGRNVQSR